MFVSDLADRVLASTVGIQSSIDGGGFSGSGTVISSDGHILTSTSVVPRDAGNVTVLFSDFIRRPATVVAVDDALSTALIKVDARDLACLTLSRELPDVGTVAFSAGDVDDVMLANGRASFSRGIVSGIYAVTKQGEAAYEGDVVETTAAVNPGSDGGPLVDAHGRLCGVISLSVSRLRWQGVAVPTKVIVQRFEPLSSGRVKVAAGSTASPVAAPVQLVGLRRNAETLVPHLVGLEVERTWKPEQLPRISWGDERRTIADWNNLAEAARRQRFAAFANTARALDVNQLLRRPPGMVTGIVVSPDGFVLTSLFNVGDDTAFVARKTGQPRVIDAGEPLEKLLAEPEGGFEQKPNTVRKLTVSLADGSRHEARIHARHEPLGVALLKIDAAALPWFDLAAVATSPQLGDPVAVLGCPPSAGARPTLNAGIVSAPARNRGQQFQTDALLNYGNSGGPVFDAAGNFLGVAAAPIEPDTVLGRIFTLPQLMRWTRAPNSGVGLVARADRIRAVLEEMKQGRSFARIPGPFLGIQPDESRAFGENVVIGGVAAGSPAAEAGLKKGDVLLEFNGFELRQWRDLTERVAAAKAGDVVTLKVQRKGSGPRLVIAGRDIETAADLEKLKKSLKPGDTFEGTLSSDDSREFKAVLREQK
ncbi:MAG: trypsin-like peptidase domain-containing protein [Planctomycetia bacterium]|nr:trypsin-like peptidase domain-containing protein [Planctomycetia bacterium]